MSFFEVLVDFNDEIIRLSRHLGASIKRVFKKKSYEEILKETWNTRLGFIAVIPIIFLIYKFIEQFF